MAIKAGSGHTPVANRQQLRRKLVTPCKGIMTRWFVLHSVCARNQGLNGLVRGGFGPAVLCEVRKARGLKHHKGVDGVKTRLTGARAETSGHLLFQAQEIE